MLLIWTLNEVQHRGQRRTKVKENLRRTFIKCWWENKSSFVRREQQNPAQAQGKGIKAQETLILVRTADTGEDFCKIQWKGHSMNYCSLDMNITALCPKSRPDPTARAQGGNGALGHSCSSGWNQSGTAGKAQTAPEAPEKPQTHNLQGWDIPSASPRCCFPTGKCGMGTAQGKKSSWDWHSPFTPWEWKWVGHPHPKPQSGRRKVEQGQKQSRFKLRTRSIPKGWEEPQSARGGAEQHIFIAAPSSRSCSDPTEELLWGRAVLQL